MEYRLLRGLLLLLLLAATLSSTPPQGEQVRTISSLPFVITEPGVYVIATDLTVEADGIRVESPNVEIRGGGHTITGAQGHTGLEIIGGWNVTVRDLEIEGFTNGITVNVTGDPKILIENISVSGGDYGLVVDATNGGWYYGGVTVEGVEISNASIAGILLNSSYSVTVRDGSIRGSGIGIKSYYSSGIVLEDVLVEDTLGVGVSLHASNSILVVDSIISGGNGGLYASRSSKILILSSTIKDSTGDGVRLTICDHVEIVSSTMEGSAGYGVNASGYYMEWGYPHGGAQIRVVSNEITGNGRGGVYIGHYTSGVEILNNTIASNNGYGVNTTTDREFNVEGNNFIDNSIRPQARDTYGLGEWRWNYWSDLSGEAYILDGSGADNVPATQPYPDLAALNIVVPADDLAGEVLVEAVVSNPSPASSTANVTLLVGGPYGFVRDKSFTWLSVDPSTAEEVEYGDRVGPGNYTMSPEDSDDSYFIYTLPWPFQFYTHNYTYISISTNGLVELLDSNGSSVLEDDPTGYTYKYYLTEWSSSAWDAPFRGGVTTVFAITGDLNATQYLGVFNLGDKVVVAFKGKASPSMDSGDIEYEIIISRSGSITISYNTLNMTGLAGEGWAGAYIKPLNLHIPIPHPAEGESYTLNTALHPATHATATLNPGETVQVTLTINTSTLPEGNATLWLTVESNRDANPLNSVAQPLNVTITHPTTPPENTTTTTTTITGTTTATTTPPETTTTQTTTTGGQTTQQGTTTQKTTTPPPPTTSPERGGGRLITAATVIVLIVVVIVILQFKVRGGTAG